MIRIYLPHEQREALERARRIRSSSLAERCFAVLLSDRGQRVAAIAASIGRHEHTIRSWLKAYLNAGIEGLKATPPPGRANRKENEALALLQPVLAKHPSDYGCGSFETTRSYFLALNSNHLKKQALRIAGQMMTLQFLLLVKLPICLEITA